MKLWKYKNLNKSKATEIAEQCGLPVFFSMLLAMRGFEDAETVEKFLNAELSVNPFDIKDMEKAAKRVKIAIDSEEKICVFGDYDADGVTSTALLFSYLRDSGAVVEYYIPTRDEGYGLNCEAIDTLKGSGISLIVTVDNGIAAVKEIDYANSLGIDVVVTDHHKPQSTLPNAYALIDPYLSDSKLSFRGFCGAGVAFLLVMAIEGEYCDVDGLLQNFADLLCIGTVGDVVPIKEDNRAFVKTGLEVLNNSDRLGILAIIEEAGLAEKTITSGKLAFSVVPRINAVGRLGLSKKCVELLLCEDEEIAAEMAQELGEDNKNRQTMCKEVFLQAMDRLRENPAWLFDRIAVIDGENWHPGIIGIVSAKIMEELDRPVVVISSMENGSRGSGRSVKGFPLCDAIEYCKDLLTHYGGHPMAAGLSLSTKNIQKFREKINEFAEKFGTVPSPALEIDCKLNPAQLTLAMIEEIQYLEPFGEGNPEPVFALCNMKISGIKSLSGGKHIKLTLQRDTTYIEALSFFTEQCSFPYEVGDVVNIAAKLSINEYNGAKSISIIIEGIRFADFDENAAVLSNGFYETLKRGETLDREKATNIMPSREEFAAVYRFLREKIKFCAGPEVLLHRLKNSFPYGKMLVALDALCEAGLIKYSYMPGEITIETVAFEGKADLDNCAVMSKIKELAKSINN